MDFFKKSSTQKAAQPGQNASPAVDQLVGVSTAKQPLKAQNIVAETDKSAEKNAGLKIEPVKEETSEKSDKVMPEPPKKDAKTTGKPGEKATGEPAEGNVFTKLFKPEKKNAAKIGIPKPSSETKIIDRIVEQTTGETSRRKVLGAKPITRSAMLGPEYAIARRLRAVKSICHLLIFFSLLGAGFFYSQLNPEFTWFKDMFGENPVQQLAAQEEVAKNVKTEINYYRYMAAKFDLDKFLQLEDKYNTAKAKLEGGILKSSEKEALSQEKEETFEKIKTVLLAAQTTFRDPLEIRGLPTTLRASAPDDEIVTLPKVAYKSALQSLFQKKKSSLQSDTQTEEVTNEAQTLEGTLTLLRNMPLQNEIRLLEIEELKEKDIESLVSKINETSRNNFAIVAEIKKNRLDWRKLLEDIEKITKNVDPLYIPGDSSISMIVYHSFAFDNVTKNIQVQGEIRTMDSSNFDLLISFIDAFNKSGKFELSEQRDFDKTENEDWYVTPLKFNLAVLEEEVEETEEEEEAAAI